MYVRHALFLFMCSTLCTQNATARAESLKKITSLFSTKTNEDVIHKTYHLGKHPLLEITNTYGPIEIATTESDRVDIKAIKKVPAKQDGSLLQPSFKQLGANHIRIGSHAEQDIKAELTFHVTVPKTARLKFASRDGTLSAEKITGAFHATTETGSIALQETQGSINATTHQRGPITITNATGPITAVTKTGNITIHGTHNDIVASTGKGKICVNCTTVPATSTLSLTTSSGSIQLGVPQTTNACVQAKTNQGAVTCAHAITLNPFTTPLDSKAWQRFKRDVDGVLGTGEAIIKLSSARGNIKITEPHTTS